MSKLLKTIAFYLTVFAAAFLITGLAVGGTGKEAPGDVPAVLAESLSEGGYQIRAFDGRIAVFYDGFTDRPAIETTIDVQSLRAYDRQLLENGIEVEKYEDVLRLLEDFGA
jgi:hypothetical protein